MLRDAGVPPMSELGVDGAREAMRAGTVNDMEPPPVGPVSDRDIPGPAGEIPIRRYDPLDAPATTGGLIYYHGGGFVIGDLDTHDIVCRALCAWAEIRVVSVDYRLAPEHPFPAAVDDSLAAFDWVHENGADLGIDPARLAVAGDSAGGNLAAVAAQHARDAGITLRAQVLNYPVTDLSRRYPSHEEQKDTPPLHGPVQNWFWSAYLGDDWNSDQARLRDPRISPLYASSLEGLAPAFVITAGLDPLRDEGAAYARALSAAGVEVIYQCVLGTIHGFMRLGKHVPAARDALKASAAFLVSRMAPPDD